MSRLRGLEICVLWGCSNSFIKRFTAFWMRRSMPVISGAERNLSTLLIDDLFAQVR
jgi:hypothetical protein